MLFHPDKCTTLPVTRNRRTKNRDYQLHGHTLQTVESAKYLGITIQKDLQWNEHINNLFKGQQNTGRLAPVPSENRPTRRTSGPSWNTPAQCGIPMKEIDKIEVIQRRAARFVLRRCVKEMLEQLEWPSLQRQRHEARLTWMFKIRHQLSATDGLREKLHPLPQRQRRVYKQQLSLIQCRTTSRQSSFRPRTIRDWNLLPQNVAEADTLDTFVSSLSTAN